MVNGAALLVAMMGAAACADAVGAHAARVSFVIVPEFGALATFANNADVLHIVITRNSDASVVKDTTLTIDPVTGEASADLNVVLLSGSESFTLLLEAIRSSDGVVLFSGTQTVTVTSTSGTTPVSIPVSYAGPTGALVIIQPRDTAIAPGGTFTFAAVVLDANSAPVAVPVTFGLVTAADSVILRVGKYTGTATAGTGPTGTVQVVARSADGLTDTARVAVGAVPAGVRIVPGYATVGVNGTASLTANLIDAAGTVLAPATATWTSRSPSVATVSGAGLVTGAAAGTAVIVATSATFSDSMLVRVASAGSVPVSAIAGGRAFRSPKVGDTVVVDITADMAYTSGEVLGSYNAQLTWNTANLKYVSTAAVDFGAPTLNETQTAQGSLRFSAANAQGTSGAVVVARIRFVAQAQGGANLALQITELSAAQTFTNLLSNVTVTNGSVTVRP
jgi:hypothetical protein